MGGLSGRMVASRSPAKSSIKADLQHTMGGRGTHGMHRAVWYHGASHKVTGGTSWRVTSHASPPQQNGGCGGRKKHKMCVWWCGVWCVCVCVCVCGFGWGFRPSITYIYSGIEPPRQKRACTHALDAHAHAHAHARSSQRHMLSHEALYIAAALWDNQGPQLRHA